MVQIEARKILSKSSSNQYLHSNQDVTYKPLINSSSMKILKNSNKISSDSF